MFKVRDVLRQWGGQKEKRGRDAITKEFDRWNKVKKKHDSKKVGTTFYEREIWWCSVGVNIGYEVSGKGPRFVRPVVILKRVTHETFFGVPLTTTKKDIPGYYVYNNRCIILEQARFYDARRLINKQMKMHPNEFHKLQQAFTSYIIKK